MTNEKNSLLAYRAGGAMEQILADDAAIYVVRLGNVRDAGALFRSIRDVSMFRSGPNSERIPKEEIEAVHIRRGGSQTEISMNTADDERTWRMNIRIPDEAVRMIFGGLNLLCEEMDEPMEIPDDMPPVPGGELLLDVFAGALAVLLPVMWWIRAGALLTWANLLFLPMFLALLGWGAGRRWGRFKSIRAIWLLPGVGLTLMNVRVNLPNPGQIVLPALGIALMLALLYAMMCGGKRNWRKIAAVLALVLLTYAPGAALSMNALEGERLRSVRVTPRMVRSDWIEAPLDGRLQRFHVHPYICRNLSVNTACELQLHRGVFGIEYWTAVPQDWGKEV